MKGVVDSSNDTENTTAHRDEQFLSIYIEVIRYYVIYISDITPRN